MSQQTPEPGKTLGRYRLLEQIGRGGQGIVWLAMDPVLRRKVAIKALRSGFDAVDLRMRFEREAEAASKLTHPGICTVHALEEEEGTPFIVMEHVEGDGFDDWAAVARTEGRAGVDRIVRVCERIARALHAAHEAGLVHRDVKPGNIIVTEGDRPVVLDFGLARSEEPGVTVTRTGDVVGTPAYMAPEQIDGRRGRVDRRVDVFGLGVLLAEALSGARPFYATTTEGVYRRVLRDEPDDPRRRNPHVNRDLSVVCQKCLEKEPGRRYGTAEAFADDLARVRSQQPIHARPAGPWIRARRWMQRNPAVATLLATTFIGLTAFGVWSQVSARKLQTELDRSTRFAHLALARELLADVPDTWPAIQTSLPTLDQWIDSAKMLLDERERWVQGLEALPDSESSYGFTQQLHDHPREFQRWNEVRASLWSVRNLLASRTGEDAVALEAEQGRLEEELNALKEVLESRMVRRFQSGGDVEARSMLTELIQKLDIIGAEDGPLDRVERRRDFIAGLPGEIAPHRERWDEVIATFADWEEDRAKEPLKLVPQLGLVPLGRDPDSDLEEFLHLESHVGEIPVRGPDGRLTLREETGLIMVLIPGGLFYMGAGRGPGINSDPHARAEEGPVHDLAIWPFLISKYEMTQAQWRRATGATPSYFEKGPGFGPLAGLHPVENVSWLDCDRTLRGMGLRLPTEAQIEYATRATTTDSWWCGKDKESLKGAANVADADAHALAAEDVRTSADDTERWSDGWPAHAPADALRANLFGLHHTAGNVWEWCRDRYGSLQRLVKGGTCERFVKGVAPGLRVVRGGSYADAAVDARSARRRPLHETVRDPTVGVRPVWELRFQ